MKNQKISKKLFINRETVSNLDYEEMTDIAGGASNPCQTVTCATKCTCVCVSVQTGCYPRCTVPACPV